MEETVASVELGVSFIELMPATLNGAWLTDITKVLVVVPSCAVTTVVIIVGVPLVFKVIGCDAVSLATGLPSTVMVWPSVDALGVTVTLPIVGDTVVV